MNARRKTIQGSISHEQARMIAYALLNADFSLYEASADADTLFDGTPHELAQMMNEAIKENDPDIHYCFCL